MISRKTPPIQFIPTSNPVPSPRISHQQPLKANPQQKEDLNSTRNDTSSSKKKNSARQKKKLSFENSQSVLLSNSTLSNVQDTSFNTMNGDDSFFITRGPQIQFPNVKKHGGGTEKNITPSDVDIALENKKAELQKIQQLLEQKRKEYEANDIKWKEKELELTKKRNELDSGHKEMKQFNQINESKIDKYYRKAMEEQKQNESKRQQIQDLQATIIHLTKQKKKKESELKKIHLYQNYLNMVARFDNNTFEDDMDKILKRYEILHNSSTDLENQIETKKQLIKHETNELKNFQKQAQNKLYELNVELQHKRQLLEKLKAKTYSLESAYSQQDITNRKFSQLYSQVVMSINNLHQRCVETRKFKPSQQPKFVTASRVEKNVPEEFRQLQAIQNRIQEVEFIVNAIKKAKE
ncbi:hypothetical protein FDP41_004946 [Naegleria fowleri]|uniref:DUF4200 domain-containing protein n=1 Tax=Naegleria fowleri TaxID=5763 RepID=A0A6A5BPV7_NAEFO|nr:uncharacterized protein FDP41_004946 [Naegleria fowleri]KAF0976271.1 hypothetical protein FDP41_004946 [Naegleria fowleri]CAG4716456.1 unnamed protein product [Naegleria fowleri]